MELFGVCEDFSTDDFGNGLIINIPDIPFVRTDFDRLRRYRNSFDKQSIKVDIFKALFLLPSDSIKVIFDTLEI